jgi:hypothetical protein
MNTATSASCFSTTTGKLIPIEDANSLIASHQEATKENESAVDSYYFGRDQIKNLLEQPGCIGIRVHFGMNVLGVQKLVILPADEYGVNINLKNSFGEDVALDWGAPCPPLCPPPVKIPQ